MRRGEFRWCLLPSTPLLPPSYFSLNQTKHVAKFLVETNKPPKLYHHSGSDLYFHLNITPTSTVPYHRPRLHDTNIINNTRIPHVRLSYSVPVEGFQLELEYLDPAGQENGGSGDYATARKAAMTGPTQALVGRAWNTLTGL